MIYEAVIIGGGPSGLMAANVLEEKNIPYLLLEKNDKLAKKLLLTGGKRCNVTNNLPVDRFIESLNMKHRRFLYHALKSFGPHEIVDFYKQRGLGLLLEQDLKYFPETHKSQSVLDALLRGIKEEHIHYVENVKWVEKDENLWKVTTTKNTYLTKNVIVATGSKAYPTTGSSGDGVTFAEHLGIKTIPFTPAETHVYADVVKNKFKDLQGIAISNARMMIEGQKGVYHGGVLFTHFGLSGPAVLHASEMIAKQMENGKVYVTFALSELEDDEVINRFEDAFSKHESLQSFLEGVVIKRLVKMIPEWLQITPKNINEYAKKERDLILSTILKFKVLIDRVESIEHAFVNAGGIDANELDPKTMMSKTHRGLYFIGEINDLQGPIGGFNLTIAFSTGHLAATNIINK